MQWNLILFLFVFNLNGNGERFWKRTLIANLHSLFRYPVRSKQYQQHSHNVDISQKQASDQFTHNIFYTYEIGDD